MARAISTSGEGTALRAQSPSPLSRSASTSLQAAAAVNAGLQQEDSRREGASMFLGDGLLTIHRQLYLEKSTVLAYWQTTLNCPYEPTTQRPEPSLTRRDDQRRTSTFISNRQSSVSLRIANDLHWRSSSPPYAKFGRITPGARTRARGTSGMLNRDLFDSGLRLNLPTESTPSDDSPATTAAPTITSRGRSTSSTRRRRVYSDLRALYVFLSTQRTITTFVRINSSISNRSAPPQLVRPCTRRFAQTVKNP